MKRFIDLANIVLRRDGLAIKVDFKTTEGDIEMEIPVAGIADIMSNLANLAILLGQQQGLPANPDSTAYYSVVVPVDSVKLVQDPSGKPNFLFRAGVVNFVFPFDPQVLAQDAKKLTATLQGLAATDKARRKK